MQWYFILGIITCLIGGYRNLKGKQSIEITELDGLCWFLIWWVFLPIFIISWGVSKIKKMICYFKGCNFKYLHTNGEGEWSWTTEKCDRCGKIDSDI